MKTGLFVIAKNLVSFNFRIIKGLLKNKGGGFINSSIQNTSYLLDLQTKHDFIFIHINKTGGSAVEKALGTIDQVHLSAYVLKNHLGSINFNNKFKFAFVRNPYDRLVSQYHYRLQNDQTGVKSEALSFKDWFKSAYMNREEPYYNFPAMFQPQLDWVTDDKGEIIVDFIGRFENLQNDFDLVCDKIGVQPKVLAKRRKSDRRDDYMSYYDDELKLWVQTCLLYTSPSPRD